MTTLHGSLVGDTFAAICWKVGTPFAYKAFLLYEGSDWEGLTRLKVPIGKYTCAATLFGDLQVAAFFKKYQGFTLDRDLEAEAREGFWKSERLCYHSNERLSPLLFDLNHYGERVGRLFRQARKEIRVLLGKVPSLNRLQCKFGPGSTFLNVGDNITVAHKLSEDYSLTRQASFVLSDWDLSAWSRSAACSTYYAPLEGGEIRTSYGKDVYQPSSEACFAIREAQYVLGNRFTTVEKDATKLRGICIEPSINVFYQLGVGKYIAGRLRRWGWDKETAQDFHKSLARIGSLTGAVATVDLSNASDTICRNLVKLLLPEEWYRLVDDLRSSRTLIDGRWVKLEKFSSMGNGFTFELETLIFWALARALRALEPETEDPFTPGVTISVYGDDIVLPSSMAQSYLAVMSFCGFQANPSKTFLSGAFRESCGGDYFRGEDVRPHYQKEDPNEPHKIIAFANGLRRFNIRMSRITLRDFCRPLWFSVLDALPRSIRDCRGPEALGDLVVNDNESHWSTKNPIRTRGSIRYVKVWRPVPNRKIGWENFRPGVVLSAALYGVTSGSPDFNPTSPNESWRRSGVVPRIAGSYVSGYRHGRVAYS